MSLSQLAEWVLIFDVAALLVVHLTWNAFENRRLTAWLELFGVLLLVLGLAAPLVRPTDKPISRNANDGAEVWGPDEPYWAILQADLLIGALLVIAGLGTEVAKQVGRTPRDRRARGQDSKAPS